MGIEHGDGKARFFAIQASREGVTTRFTVHGFMVVADRREVPVVPIRISSLHEGMGGHTDRVDGLTRLAERAAAGDRDAMATFVARTQGDVWRLCAHLVDRDAADDVTQDVYLRALPALSSFRGEASARTWLLSIARRTCMDELRGRSRRRALIERVRARVTVGPGVHPDPAEGVTLDDVVASLDPDRREAFVLTQVLGLSYAETAEICGCEIGTVRSRVSRARSIMVDRLRADGPDASATGG